MITSESELDALYGEPVRTSLLKEIDHISPDYGRYIMASPMSFWQQVVRRGWIGRRAVIRQGLFASMIRKR